MRRPCSVARPRSCPYLFDSVVCVPGSEARSYGRDFPASKWQSSQKVLALTLSVDCRNRDGSIRLPGVTTQVLRLLKYSMRKNSESGNVLLPSSPCYPNRLCGELIGCGFFLAVS